MNHLPDDELVRHARALRGLARALVGAQDADDLVQETAAQVLHSAPADVGSWFSWFGGVMRRRAAMSHRSAARRRQREQAAGRARELASESTLRIAAHRETIARLDAALLGLPEPYQGTLLLRYFEDLTPTEIAARTGQPVATVKSRLQRGLGMLRERLGEGADEHGPRDWRAGLVGAFGLGREGSAVAGAMAVGAMVGTMAMTKCLLGAAAVALAAFWLWPREVAPSPTAMAPASSDAAVAAATASAPKDERVAVSSSEVPTAPTNSAATQELVTFVGRCVDEAGAPLAGAAVGASTRRWDGGREFASDDQTTGERGEFVARLPLAPKCYHRIEIKAADRCQVEGGFHDMAPGQRVELGDIVVPLACSYRGRVVDTAGVPQAGVQLELRGYQNSGKQLRTVVYDNSGAVTDRDGTFTSSQKLPADHYQLAPRNRKLVRATSVLFTLGATSRDAVLELVVEPAPTPCRGIVVNEVGEPIARARLGLDDNYGDTGVDGRFELLPNPNRQGVERMVSCSAEGFAQRNTSWRLGDTNELRIMLATYPTLTVRVVDARDRRPITRFQSNVVMPNSWSDSTAQGMQDHPDGTCRVPIAAGHWWVRVRAADEQLAPSAFVPVQILPGQSAAVTVELFPWLTRRLVVTDGRAPVAGVQVQLLDPGDTTVRCNTETFPFDDCRVTGPPLACIVQQGATDQDGAIALRGPLGALALRLSGGGLAMQIVQPIRLDENVDLRVVAMRGASWRGKLVPEAVARELWSLGQPQPNVVPEKVGIELHREDGESLHRFLEAPFPFAADGNFAIDGIPAGTWHVSVRAKHGFEATTITVGEGQQLEQDVDVQAMAIADVTLRIRIDGEPAVRTYVNIMGSHAPDSVGQRLVTQSTGRTDDAGCFRLLTYVGELQAHVYWESGTGKGGVLRSAVAVRTAGEQELVLDVQRGALDLTVLTPEGQPAGGLCVQLNVGSWRPTGDDVTAADGTLRRSPMAAGSYELRARPARLQTERARSEFAQANGWRALEEAWVAVGTIDVAPGAARPQTVRLPAAWSR